MFRNYAESNRGFKSFQVQVSTASLEQQRRRDQQQVAYLKENARFAAANAREFLSEMDLSHRKQMAWRRELKDFYDMNAEHIFEAEKMELKARLDAAEYKVQNPGVGKPQQSTLEKIQPFLQLAGKAVGMMAEAHEARVKEEVKGNYNVIQNSDATQEMRIAIEGQRDLLWQNSNEGLAARTEFLKKFGVEGPADLESFDKQFPEQNWHSIINASGEQQTLYTQAFVRNTHKKWGGEVWKIRQEGVGAKNPTMVTMPDGSQISAYHALNSGNDDPELFRLAYTQLYNRWKDENQIGPDHIPLSIGVGEDVQRFLDSTYNSHFGDWVKKRNTAVVSSRKRDMDMLLQKGGSFLSDTGKTEELDNYLDKKRGYWGVKKDSDGNLIFPSDQIKREYLDSLQDDVVRLAGTEGITRSTLDGIINHLYPGELKNAPWIKDLQRAKTFMTEKAIATAERMTRAEINTQTSAFIFRVRTDEQFREYMRGLGQNGAGDLLRGEGWPPNDVSAVLSAVFADEGLGVTPIENFNDQFKGYDLEVEKKIVSHLRNEVGITNLNLSNFGNQVPHSNTIKNIAVSKWERDFNSEYVRTQDTTQARNWADTQLNRDLEAGAYDISNVDHKDPKSGSTVKTNLDQLEWTNFSEEGGFRDELLATTDQNIEIVKQANNGQIESTVKNNISEIIPVEEITAKYTNRDGSLNTQRMMTDPALVKVQEQLPPNTYSRTWLIDKVAKAAGHQGLHPIQVTDIGEYKKLMDSIPNYPEQVQAIRSNMNYALNVEKHPSSKQRLVQKAIAESKEAVLVQVGDSQFRAQAGGAAQSLEIARIEAAKAGVDLDLVINNIARTAKENKDAGGVANSLHLRGLALDINWNAPGAWWWKQNSETFGWKHIPYSSKSTHYELQPDLWENSPYYVKQQPQQAAPAVQQQPQQTSFPPWLTPQKALEKSQEYGGATTPAGKYWEQVANIIAGQRREVGVGL